jgi:hypothetical protein
MSRLPKTSDADASIAWRLRDVAMTEQPVAKITGASQSDAELIDRNELARRLNLHTRTVRRMVSRCELPKPCLSTGGRPRWLWSHVIEHCRKRHLHEDDLDRRRRRKLNRSPPGS